MLLAQLCESVSARKIIDLPRVWAQSKYIESSDFRLI
jgi:hypothetical protein